MRLIDADALIAEYCEDCEAYLNKVCDRDVCGTVLMLATAPTIDAVEVVRCKDCVWCEQGKSYEPYCNHPTDGMCDVQRDDFCSYGERRSE